MKKLKKIVPILLMIIMTVCGVISLIGITTRLTISEEGLSKVLKKSDYVSQTKKTIVATMENYLPANRVESITKEINIKSQLTQITKAFDNNTMSESSEKIRIKVSEVIYDNSADMAQNDDDAKQFSNMLSSIYMKTLFPTTEAGYISNVIQRYEGKLNIITILLAIIAVICLLTLCFNKKEIKWSIIGLYNIIIFVAICAALISINSDIQIGGANTSLILSTLFNNMVFNLIIEIITICVIVILINYFAYFKKKSIK
ncbi:MAG: hypothetical protein PHR25_01065 [Clostridia bacterium]|nr:hypothetical protein [Clostridia bacterium]MDD4375357.1 hypothetical protein [Clostridia bacterium]